MGKTGVPAAGGGNAGLLFWARNIHLLTVHLFLASSRAEPPGCPPRLVKRAPVLFVYFLSSKSAATKTAKTTEMMPFMVKKAALSLERSSGLTSECSVEKQQGQRDDACNCELTETESGDQHDQQKQHDEVEGTSNP